MKTSRVPAATINRLSLYARGLEGLQSEGHQVVSSERLAELCQVNPAQVRKDLAYFGEFGVRGVGYYVRELLFEIRKILGINRSWRLACIGMGNLGRALVSHENFAMAGYIFVAALDCDPDKIGHPVGPKLVIEETRDMVEIFTERKVDIAVITTPSVRAQAVANKVAESPVRAILNFAPVQLVMPQDFVVENVDFTVKLDNLAYHLSSI